jgi:DNA repair photolyase
VLGPEVLLSLVAPLRPGDALAPGVTLVSACAEPTPGLQLEDHGVKIVVEVAPRIAGARSAAETERFMLSYRAGPEVEPRRGQELCRKIAARILAREAEVLATLAAELAADGATRIRRVRATQALEPRDIPGAAHYGLSPYVGCLIGCRFCYAQSKLMPLRGLLGLAAAPWGSWVDVRADLPELLREELKTAEPRPVKLTPIVSDPYQAVESRERLTRRCLAVLAGAPAFTPLVLTRSAAIREDLEQIAALPGAHVGVSLPTIDEEVLAHFEPRAATAAARLQVLRDFTAAGVTTFAVVQPLLPGPVEALADALAERVASVHLDVLHGEEAAEADFSDVRYSMSREASWQRARARQLADALRTRGVAIWTGELPPTLIGAGM